MKKKLIYKDPDVYFYYSNILKLAQRSLMDSERMKRMQFNSNPIYVIDQAGKVSISIIFLQVLIFGFNLFFNLVFDFVFVFIFVLR